MNSSFMLLLKVWIWGTWTDDLAAKSAGCSSRGPSTMPRTYIGRLTTTYKSSSGASNAIFWPLWYLHTQHILTHMYKQKLSKNKSSKMWSFFKKVSSVIQLLQFFSYYFMLLFLYVAVLCACMSVHPTYAVLPEVQKECYMQAGIFVRTAAPK